jgi:hypothetical protein
MACPRASIAALALAASRLGPAMKPAHMLTTNKTLHTNTLWHLLCNSGL